MKKILALTMIFAMASLANAGLVISVDGIPDPEDSSVNLLPSDECIIDIHVVQGPIVSTGMFLDVLGPGVLDVTYATNVVPTGSVIDLGPGMGQQQTIMIDALIPGVPPGNLEDGVVIDGMLFHCEGPGDVTLILTDLEMNILDTQVIHQIPEPMTMALLGLGGLFLRRRK